MVPYGSWIHFKRLIQQDNRLINWIKKNLHQCMIPYQCIKWPLVSYPSKQKQLKPTPWSLTQEVHIDIENAHHHNITFPVLVLGHLPTSNFPYNFCILNPYETYFWCVTQPYIGCPNPCPCPPMPMGFMPMGFGWAWAQYCCSWVGVGAILESQRQWTTFYLSDPTKT